MDLERTRQQVLTVVSSSSQWPPDRSSTSSRSVGTEEARQAQDRLRRLLAAVGESSAGSRLTSFDVNTILREMAGPHRDILIMRGFAGLTATEIAFMLEKPLSDAEADMKEATDDFRRRLQAVKQEYRAMDRVASVILSVCPRFNIGGGRDGANPTMKATYNRSAGETGDTVQREVQQVYRVLCTWLLPDGVPREPTGEDPIAVGGSPDGATWITINPDLLRTIQ